jgi:hypothetical protein
MCTSILSYHMCLNQAAACALRCSRCLKSGSWKSAAAQLGKVLTAVLRPACCALAVLLQAFLEWLEACCATSDRCGSCAGTTAGEQCSMLSKLN